MVGMSEDATIYLIYEAYIKYYALFSSREGEHRTIIYETITSF